MPAQKGFSYIGVMVTLVIAAIGMQGAAVMWQQQTQRDNEASLLETGEAYRLAIGRYYESTPQPVKQYPVRLEELLEDKRFPVPKRHLRKLYPDPFSVKQGMTLVVKEGRIVGVHSQSLLEPIRHSGYQESQTGFLQAKHYRDWLFVYEPNTLADLEQAWVNR
jgi:type II secretory pathway pseudopilin PulG